ncbi:DUF1302 family protein [Hydrocarboniphaga sp.]|uniref:DUF1302 family protein n=1 Tax=Hydrocarboniphaga sp. TaxID=2033016 RepID=UPI003D1129B3
MSLSSLSAHAGWFSDTFPDFSWDYGGFVRQETAISTVSDENPNNQGGNTFQNQTATRQAYLPPALIPGGQLINWGAVPLPYRDTVKRSDFVQSTDNDFNYVVFRGELEFGAKFGEKWDFIARLRGLYQPDAYDDFDAASVSGLQGGITGGDPRLYHGKVNYFDYITEGGSKGNPLEWSGRNYQLYLPAAVLNYRDGGLNVRVGNQTIAWGQSIYLRVFDVPNGLDLRRHLIFDRGFEEFSDKRVPSLSARVTYQLTDSVLLDSYVEKFQPSIFGNPNTPFNVIPAQFTVRDLYKEDGDDTKLSAGFRLKADYGDWGWQAAYVNRMNPDGAFRWTETGVSKPLQGGVGSLGSVVNTAYNAKLPAAACGGLYDPSLCRLYADSGEALSHSPLEVAPAGVYSADEWFDYAAQVRLNGVTGLNAAINDFSGSKDLYATPVDNYEQAASELNTFFIAAGGSLRGHIAREYFRENVLMLGGSYVNSSDNDFLNELIFNVEAQYIPDRTFTATDLNTGFKKTDEYTISLVVDKWHRFFNEFPGTYIVFEALTKNRSDLVGRLLEGYGGDRNHAAPGKKGNANYVVFGFLQPWPNKLYEFELATLYDPDGGIFIQPGLRWHPGHDITVEGFYNYTNGHLYGDPNGNLIAGLEFAQEFTMRFSYQF